MRRGKDPLANEIRSALERAYASPPDLADLGEWAPDDHPNEFLLASYLEHRLRGVEETALERHVAFCPSCAEELVLARRTGVGRAVSEHRRGWKMAAGFALVFGGLVAALLTARVFGGRLEGMLLARLQQSFGGKALVEDMSLAWANGPGVDLHGLRLTDDPTSPAEPLLVAPSATLALDVRALGHGELDGTLKLDHPVLNVIRESSGHLNLDAVLPKRGGGGPGQLIAEAGSKLVENIEVSAGTVRVIDRSGMRPLEIRMAAVDAKLSGLTQPKPAHLEAHAGLESSSQNIALEGDVGPWGGEEPPTYAFSKVALSSIPLRSLPYIGSVMRGGFSYDGGLASTGESWDEIRDRLHGEGEASVVSGAIAGRNLIAQVLEPITSGVDLGGAGSLVASADTGFNEIAGHVRIEDTRLASNQITVSGNGFSVDGRCSIGLDGRVEFEGDLRVQAAATRELIAAAPGAAALVNERGELTVPFTIAGSWPNIDARVNIERLAARTLPRMFVRLRLGPFRMPLPLLGAGFFA